MSTPRLRYGPVESEEALLEVLETIRKEHSKELILLRGQCELYDTIRSGRSRPNFKSSALAETGWSGYLRYMLGVPDQAISGPLVQSILQHYGLATHYVDLTSSAEVAAWFALNEYKPRVMQFIGTAMRSIPQAKYERLTEGIGNILVLAFPNQEELRQREYLIDLTHLPDTFARPHRQSGWLMFDHPPVKPNPTDYWVATIEIDRSKFETGLSMRDVFPGQKDDPAYGRMLSLPFVQTPAYYFQGDEKKDEKLDGMFEDFLFANPCVEVTEYYEDDGVGNHKWGDYTLYEPKPMRLWKSWRYDLAKDYPGVEGDVRDAVKITVSPTALERLKSHANEYCDWPALDSNNLLFTFAEIDHDKVIEHQPPYRGKWLVKSGELIVEKDMEADRRVLSVGGGHGYLLRNGKLELCTVENACQCGHPELHLQSIRSLLQVPRLVSEGKLLLLPHPKLSALGWYVVITENDHQGILENVAGFQQVVAEVHRTLIQRAQQPSDDGSRKASPGQAP